ncbi:TPA: phage major capsid protein, P2 family [Salmonella enterica]|uniref:Phage major capsid protein, P2 family n=1 Tax=Salmonella enterica subsp. enterica serovar 4,[5],12:b:- TaxID=1340177 RepID=A0A739CNV9_SALET|nr:phage major capsid protein, P2 family [Salmonella enterica subsp. enterica serovar Enteritidis]EAO8116995.1 phage major capsid protein, P2 family [Salmonella enterica]ECG1112949.1 phage major capsid protein, P2 family [Salmonella enterica subsp. enterica]ECM3643189.1 phage major capsid protein, P2 family [Salmonella enterica subsp. enterica serovar Typhimurium]EDP9262647.1 phage major capsid protein, P2 family [Salmonella enterica subsp. houtenae]EDW2145473.1 phage major capsid protein, P2 
MRKDTRFKFNQYLSRIAELNGIEVSDLNKKFTVEPSVTQTLFDKIQQSSSFLKLINMVTVGELTEEKVGIDVTGSIASTADTDGGVERKTADFAKMDAYRYFCHPVNFDYHLKYNKLDLWARFQDFQIRIRNAIIKRQALDYITIGFNGVSRAATSDRSKNPLLQDVAVGWLQKYRNDAPERVMSSITDAEGAVVSNTIKVGKGGHYANLDALVMDAFESLVAEIHRENPEMVVICGRRILTDKYFPMINKFQANSEQLAGELIISQKTIGQLQAVRAPFFPANSVFITTLDNISIYLYEDGHRRHIVENPKLDQVENYEQVKVDFVIEDYEAGCLIENIEILEPEEPATTEPVSAEVFAAAMVKAMQSLTGTAPASALVSDGETSPAETGTTDGKEA